MPTATAAEKKTLRGWAGMAAHIGRSLKTVQYDYRLGRLPAGYKIGNIHYWHRREIDAWLEHGAPLRAEWEPLWLELRKAG